MKEEIAKMIRGMKPPIESVRLEFDEEDGVVYVRIIIVTPSGFVFEDTESISHEVIEWQFSEAVTA